LECGEQRASIPESLAPDELTVEKAKELLNAPSDERVLGIDPETGQEVVLKSGRYGPYVQLVNAEDPAKSKSSSLFQSMVPGEITLEDGLKLLSLPRLVGKDPETNVEIWAKNGRYGPYIQRDKDSRTLDSEDMIFTVTLEQALDLLAKPKENRFKRAASSSTVEIGLHPESEKKILLKSGRFGYYVTDGEINASLRKGDDPLAVTLERAVELLAERMILLESQGKLGKGKGSKKATATKTATKKKAAASVKKKPAAKKAEDLQ
jgi:DNA topoisomerase-1